MARYRRRSRRNPIRGLAQRGARHAVKTKATPQQVAKAILAELKKSPKSRVKWLKRTGGKDLVAHISSGKAKKSSKETRAMHQMMKRQIINELVKAGQIKSRKRLFAKHAGKRNRKAKNAARRARKGSKRVQHVLPAVGLAAVSKRKRAKIGRRLAAHASRAVANRGRRRARRNSYGAIGLSLPVARRNQGLRGLVQTATPYVLSGAMGAGVHAVLGFSGATEMIADQVVKVPVVGQVVDYAPYSLQGVTALLAAAGLSYLIPTYRAQLLTAGASALGVGVGIDVLNATSLMGGSAEEEAIDAELEGAAADLQAPVSGFGALALENGLGDLAYIPQGSFALGNMGDGMAYQTAPLTVAPDGGADYGQASLGDAEYCGADLSSDEGQALLNGRDVFLGRFGSPPYRMGRPADGPSHFAGRQGHRWGWVIKMLGWERARTIAALPPAQRLQVIKSLRQSALATYQQLGLKAAADAKAAVTPPASPASAAGTAAVGASGAASSLSPTGDTADYLNGYGDPALFEGN